MRNLTTRNAAGPGGPAVQGAPRRAVQAAGRLFALGLGLWAATAGAALAAERWALVLGVSRYDDPSIPALPNTVNDARTMAGALNQMGFDVYHLENAERDEIAAMVDRIAAEQRDSALGLFYFAGHGVQIGGVNYALPSNIRTRDAAQLAESAVSVNALIGELEAMGNDTLVVILDSCRNSPFPGEGAIGTGLALVDAPDNTLIAYSTAPGEIALDGSGANSPYTAALASALDGPEQDIRDVLRLVRAQVRLATGGTQTPWFIDNSNRPIMVQPRRAPGQDGALPMLDHGEVSLPATAWWTIANSADPRDFETYIDLFPETEQSSAARRQLESFGSSAPGFPLMDLGLPEANPEVPGGLRSIITECDVLATGIDGGLSLVEPVPHDLVNTRVALRACIQAVRSDPGNARLVGLLSRVLFLEERFPESMHYARLAAEGGSAAAHGAIAEMYRLGLGVPVDLVAAADAVRRGALAGSPQMRLVMGMYYREGWGVPQSFSEARRWMELAAMVGNTPAMSALGDMYRRGQLGPKAPARAVDYYLKAATLGHSDAMSAVGLAYMKADGVARDLDRGLSWLSHASEEGNPYAAFHLGRAFLTGWGVDKNPAQALAYFRLSAQRNFLQAYTYVGDILSGTAEGVAPDLPEALANYVIAREAGLLKDTLKSREEAADAQARIDALLPRMTAEQQEEGQRIADGWIADYGLLDFNLVHE